MSLSITDENLVDQAAVDVHDDGLETSLSEKRSYRVGVIGAGQMGQGIAELFLLKGHQVILYDVHSEALETAFGNLLHRIDVAIDKKRLHADLRTETQNRLSVASHVKDFALCELIIEAVVENIQIKKNIFEELSMYLTETCVMATNTSALSVSEMANAYGWPHRFLGIHFFNPAPVMPLVEIIYHNDIDEQTIIFAQEVIQALGHVAVICQDSPGFIVNRLLLPMINHAGKMLDLGVASAKDIDNAMRFGAKFPMGPLTLADFIGIDVVVSILKRLQTGLLEPFCAPADCFLKAIEKGHLGIKTKRGIFEYD